MLMVGQTLGALARPWGRVRRLPGRLRAGVGNARARWEGRRGPYPIPGGRLIRLVSGTDDVRWFLDTGAASCRSIREVLARNGLAVESFGRVLDFGCGVGRVLRHWPPLPSTALHGSDYNPRLVAWCRDNLPFARVAVNGLDRPLEADAGSFDFIYALSVFTHLTPDLERFWMAELTRVLRPGGHLLITLHGAHYLGHLAPDERAAFLAGEAVVRRGDRPGSNHCAAFHPEAYVRATLANGLEVLDFVPEGAAGNPSQDVYLLRKPAA